MKKIFICASILLTIFLLTSCGSENVVDIETIKEKQAPINTIEEKQILDKTEIEVKKIENNKELIKHNDWNIYLYENWKQIDYLTTKAKKCSDEYCMSEIRYNIINSKRNYWIVHKYERAGECSQDTFYWYNFNGNSDVLTELYENWNCFLWLNTTLNWNQLELQIAYPEDVVKNVQNKWEIDESFIIEEWFNNIWNNWIKTIDVTKLLEEKKDIPNTLTGIYSHENLLKDWYKFNNLWSIKEYYKEVWTPPSEEFGRWFTTWKTIYVEWTKILDFEVNNWWGSNLIITNPKSAHQINLSEYNYPIQAIFTSWEWAKLIINDLDTIKLIDKTNGINKTIWKR